ncbi:MULTISPECIES: ferredoxin [unclassified Streptomyces]|uniref:ferredoxin n=1 Tax=unclassified Streptomyces TaxID=2593676 RepID=UPI001907A3D8|nr:ferredoxin [Streptomyces sp. HSG2]
MRIRIHEDRCMGVGRCVETAPEVFDQDAEDSLVVLVDPTPPARLRGAVLDAAQACPVAVITVRED